MESRLQLILVDDKQRIRRVPVTSSRFTIGSAPDNDLMIGVSGMARRHAVIECFDKRVSITDCGSSTGTFINGNPVTGDVILKDRDLLVLGEHCEIEIHISEPSVPAASPGRPEYPGRRIRNASIPFDNPENSEPAPAAGIALPLMLGVAVVILTGVALYCILPARSGLPLDSRPLGSAAPATTPEAPARTDEDLEGSSNGLALTQINKLALQVMSRISRDDKSYVFSEGTLVELKEQIDQLRSSPMLAKGLKEIDRNGRPLSIEVGREMQPSLVFCTALAEVLTESNGRDTMAVARDVLERLREIRKDLGTDDADACLLVVAAYKMRSHSLASALSGSSAVKDPYRDRNVWFLHNQGTIGEAPYRFVLRFLAVGVIAQTPNRFDVQAPRLSF